MMNEGESKQSIVNELLSQSCSMNEGESKRSIVNETLSLNCLVDENKLSSTKEEKSEFTIKKKKRCK